MTRLFIIGNGFDLKHDLPTSFDPDFKRIAEKREIISHFWDIYQTMEASIWSDFENLLGKPDFNSLEGIFEGYSPDYSSERESDRDAINVQAQFSGMLKESLREFALNAEQSIESANKIETFNNLFCEKDMIIKFNYTHIIEKLYGIKEDRVLHVHGSVDNGELILGYPEGYFKPEKYLFDIRMKGRRSSEREIQDYINQEEDYYIRSAYQHLLDKTKGFYKKYNMRSIKDFIHNQKITKIIVMGHSYRIDIPYFEYLSEK